MGDFSVNALYSGKTSGSTSRCGSPTSDKNFGAYYLYDEELIGALGDNDKSTCVNRSDQVDTIPMFWENSAKIVFTKREDSSTKDQYNMANNYQKEVALAVLAKLLSLKNPGISLGDLSGATWFRCAFSYADNVTTTKVALNIDGNDTKFSLGEAKRAIVKPAKSNVSLPVTATPGETAEIKFNLVAPIIGIKFNNQTYNVQKDFTGTITIALSRTSKFELKEPTVRAIAPGTVEVTAKIKVPAEFKTAEDYAEQCSDNFLRFLAMEAMFGEIIVNYDGSKIASVPLSKLVSVGPQEQPETPPTQPETPARPHRPYRRRPRSKTPTIIFGPDTKTEPKAEPKTEPKAEPKTEPKPEPKPGKLKKCKDAYPPAMQPAMKAAGKCI